jgi:LuxR family transcriptional regulator, maltose regulon positive regulatory protein
MTVPRAIVARERLFARMDRLAAVPLTLVGAPAGFGKTALVRSWLAARPDMAAAWISPGGASGDALDELAAGRAGDDRPAAIVLDDLDAVRDAAFPAALERAVELLPPHVRLVATARAEPAIGLARLRGHGLAGDIGARELAFTADEARELLVGRLGLELDDESVATLVERTEGWPAGLYLASLGLRDDPNGHDAIDRHVDPYLTDEVLDRLDPALRSFVDRTAVLGRFTAAMCDDVLDRDDSETALAVIRRSNLFLVEPGASGGWSRYYGFFAEVCRRDLARHDPAAVVELHRRASSWCAERGLTGEAVEHAAAAGDEPEVARLLADHYRAVLPDAGDPALLARVERLPAELLLAHPELPVAAALGAVLRSRPGPERRRLVRVAERAREQRPERWTTATEAALCLVEAGSIDGDVGAAVRASRRAVDLGRGPEPETAVAALVALAFSLYLAGDLEEAREVAHEAVDRPEATNTPHGLVLSLAVLALVEAEVGQIRNTEVHARRAIELAHEHGLAGARTTGIAHLALASALAASGRLREAEREAERGELLRRQEETSVPHVHALLVLAGIRTMRGELARAERDVAVAREGIAGFADPGRLPVLLAGVEGALEEARARAVAHRPPEDPSEAELAVLQLLATDLSLRDIGARLYRSRNTVKTQARELYRKLGASSREEAVASARALGLIP